jgi:hypothetical protein
MQSVKKSAAICGECSLIAHQKCIPNAPLSCDIRAQFLLYAENNTGFAQAADYFAANHARDMGSSSSTKGSVTSYRTSFDAHQASSGATSPSPNLHPPVAFKGVSPFKRSRSSLLWQEPAVAPSTPSTKNKIPVRVRHHSLGSAGPGDVAGSLEVKTQEQPSTLSLEEESWDDEPSIMVDPDLQLVGLISVSLLSQVI